MWWTSARPGAAPASASRPSSTSSPRAAPTRSLPRSTSTRCPTRRQHYSVSALPTFLVFKDGKEVARIQGADEAGLRAALDKAGCPPPKNDVALTKLS